MVFGYFFSDENMAVKPLPYGIRGIAIWHLRHCQMAVKALPYGSQDIAIWQPRHCHMALKTLPYGSQNTATIMWHKFVTTPVDLFNVVCQFSNFVELREPNWCLELFYFTNYIICFVSNSFKLHFFEHSKRETEKLVNQPNYYLNIY